MYIIIFIMTIILAVYITRILNWSEYNFSLKNYIDKEQWYHDNFDMYLKDIEAFKETKANKNIITKIKEIYKDRKDKLYLDELEMKDIINNLEKYNDGFVISIFLSCMGILVSINIAIYNNTKDINGIIYTFIVIFLIVILAMIHFDIEAKKRSREIAFYNLCLEVILKIENGELQ